MKNTVKKIAINTGGGDAPGLNAVIRSVVHSALQLGWECYGIRDGYNGMLFPEQYKDVGGGFIPLTAGTVRGITHLGGTILGTTNRGNPARFPELQSDGSYKEVDRMPELAQIFQSHDFDGLVAIGGDGSLAIANRLHTLGVPVVGVPKTIDNDLDCTLTFGFDSAVAFATECIDRLHSTAEAHSRVIVVEVMGRHAGWIALHAGVAGTADVVLIPEIPYDISLIAKKILEREERGRTFSIVVVAEGALPAGGTYSVIGKSIGQAERIGGVGAVLAQEIELTTKKETRTVVLGHLLRGGSPTNFDRLLSLRLGSAAIRAFAEEQTGTMVAFDGNKISLVPLHQALGTMKTVPLDSDIILTARQLGISFGD